MSMALCGSCQICFMIYKAGTNFIAGTQSCLISALNWCLKISSLGTIYNIMRN